MKYVKIILSMLIMSFFSIFIQAQIRMSMPLNGAFAFSGINAAGSRVTIPFPYELPVYTLQMDEDFFASFCSQVSHSGDTLLFLLGDSIQGSCYPDTSDQYGVRYLIRFTNQANTDHRIENLVPLGEGTDKTYITASGTKEWPDYLCRSKLFRPGYGPVGVILPDNAWHLGFADFRINDTLSLAALARRTDRHKEKTKPDRWAVTLMPGGWVEYSLWLEPHSGDWQEGLALMFQKRYLHDLDTFDLSLYRRNDLKWMNHAYIMLLQFAWDRKYYDWTKGSYSFYQSFFEYDSLTGGYDIFTLWPTWPRLGLDQRNQWDMYRDLPGSIPELRKQTDLLHSRGKRYFISYNPWDESGRKEDHLAGMEELLRLVDADGVVLDTRGASSYELQATADLVKPGIIMYSEGMAVPKDMPGIVSGRVHDALVMPPPVNLNKLIKPDFAIFRVLQLADDRIHREVACAFFNGYGVEINTMRPGRPAWIPEEFGFLGRTTRLLRENSTVFHNYLYRPLLETNTDSIYVNQWQDSNKWLFTVLSMNPEGHSGALFTLDSIPTGTHLVNLWEHENITPEVFNNRLLIPVEVSPFNRSWLHSRREGAVSCVAILPELISGKLMADSLLIKTPSNTGDKIVVTAGNPAYGHEGITLEPGTHTLAIRPSFPVTTEKIVIQLFDGNNLLDEYIVFLDPALPVLVSKVETTPRARNCPPEMVEIPKGSFHFYTHRAEGTLEPFIGFPDRTDTVICEMSSFFMDRYPVTNHQWSVFLKETGYQPVDTANYLKHWINGKIPEGEESFPVVYVSPEDIRAYAFWKGKRLPTEQEWQYAAQGLDLRSYPWGNEPDSTRCNFNLNHPTAVNLFPEGKSPFGVEDLIGNVWQLTNDVYFNGSYYFAIIRGGSYYHPATSIWYVAGGPMPADHPEMLLLNGPGLNRNATVGFRLVKDVAD